MPPSDKAQDDVNIFAGINLAPQSFVCYVSRPTVSQFIARPCYNHNTHQIHEKRKCRRILFGKSDRAHNILQHETKQNERAAINWSCHCSLTFILTVSQQPVNGVTCCYPPHLPDIAKMSFTRWATRKQSSTDKQQLKQSCYSLRPPRTESTIPIEPTDHRQFVRGTLTGKLSLSYPSRCELSLSSPIPGVNYPQHVLRYHNTSDCRSHTASSHVTSLLTTSTVR